MSLKTIDTIRHLDGDVFFKIRQNEHNTLFVEHERLFLAVTYSYEEYKKDKARITKRLRSDLSKRLREIQ